MFPTIRDRKCSKGAGKIVSVAKAATHGLEDAGKVGTTHELTDAGKSVASSQSVSIGEFGFEGRVRAHATLIIEA